MQPLCVRIAGLAPYLPATQEAPLLQEPQQLQGGSNVSEIVGTAALTDVHVQGGLLIDFDNSGGHAVLVMKASTLPTLLNADFTFRSEELVKGDQVRSGVSSCPQPIVCIRGSGNGNAHGAVCKQHITEDSRQGRCCCR